MTRPRREPELSAARLAAVCTPAEHAEVKAAAERLGVSISDLVRHATLNTIRKRLLSLDD